ncbi:hypothetical protein MBLNU459_g4887t1 [Dothideomycetes sp. NU459]
MLSQLRAFKRVHPRHARPALISPAFGPVVRRSLLTLAIETSCDDTSVAVLEKHDAVRDGPAATLHFHAKVTANTNAYNGIHPIVALESHQAELAPLVDTAVRHLPRTPDFVSVTRGPGMRSNLAIGLDTAKGLSLAWQVPLLAVHHMQAHALTPRLMSALSSPSSTDAPGPSFPFLTLLVSGGHSMLLNSTALTEHTVLATTSDIALGDCLDKAARAILPPHLVTLPYGRALEKFAYPAGPADYHYVAPANRERELQRRVTRFGWGLGPPLAESKAGKSNKRMAYSFSGLLSGIERFIRYTVDPDSGSLTKQLRPPGQPSDDERRELAREVNRVAFEHLASRVTLHLSSLPREQAADIRTLVVSGGVAANAYLRHVMRSFLDVRGFGHVDLCFPPIEFCTDNAAMIAWAGIEMWEAGWRSELSVKPIRTWSMDPKGDDGGIVGVQGWTLKKISEARAGAD